MTARRRPLGLLEHLISAIESEDVDAFGACYAESATLHEPMLPEAAVSRAQIMEGEQALFDAFGDIHVELVSVVESPRGLIVEVVLSATNDGPLAIGPESLPPTGRSIRIPQVWSFDLDENGLIRSERDYFDTAAVKSQLGLGET